MMLMEEMHKVINFANEAHQGQFRRYTNEPFIIHPTRVSFTVASVTDDVDVIAAAYLHDVVEDTDATFPDILELCNQRVVDFVMDVTDISSMSDGNRAARKMIDRAHIAKARPESKTIKLADILDNGPDIIEHDPGFAKVWMKEKEETLPLLSEGNNKLFMKVAFMIRDYNREIGRVHG